MGNTSILAMVPARIGSTRLKAKNLAMLDGKPLIFYAIDAAKEANIFNRVVLNGDSEIFAEIAERYGIEFYLRPKYLGGSDVKSDQVVEDFIDKNPCDVVAWVNPIAPLQTGAQIREIVEYFHKEEFDTVHTVRSEQVHGNLGEQSINYNPTILFERTQDLRPISLFAYSLMIWRTSVFKADLNSKGHAFFCGKVGYYDVGKLAGLLVKDKQDLYLIDSIMRQQSTVNLDAFNVEYEEALENIS